MINSGPEYPVSLCSLCPVNLSRPEQRELEAGLSDLIVGPALSNRLNWMTSLAPFQPKLFCDFIIYFSIDLIGKKTFHVLETTSTGNGVRVSSTDEWDITWKKGACSNFCGWFSERESAWYKLFTWTWSKRVKYCLVIFLSRDARFWKPSWEKTDPILNYQITISKFKKWKAFERVNTRSAEMIAKIISICHKKRWVMIAEVHQAWEIMECNREVLSWLC